MLVDIPAAAVSELMQRREVAIALADDGLVLIEVAPGIRSVASYGHTPGHTSYLVSSGSDQLMVLGDVTNLPALFVRNPGWHAAFDQDAAMAESARRKMFDRVVADNITITGYHYGMPGAGRIAKDGSGYAYTPIAV